MTGYKRKIVGNSARADGGFTLIEIMIVVVIVAILTGIALPAYQQYARKAKRADAHSALLRIATLQEKFFSNNNQYATSTVALGYAANPAASNEGYWAITIATAGAPPMSYTLTAAPAGGHVDTDCATITLTSTGVRSSTPDPNCW
jgi:type IV pilus assembly protein PilE